MADVVLFHHIQGLTPGVLELAERWRAAGHTVHTPDVYDGHTFDTLDEGLAYARKVGFGELLERGVRAADGLPAELVYLGISLGVMPAQQLAQNRPGARGALLLEGCVPPEEFGGPWPAGVPVEIHGMESDPIFAGEGDIEAARALVAASPDAKLFLYSGDRHLFMDQTLAGYDASPATELTRRVIDFLATR